MGGVFNEPGPEHGMEQTFCQTYRGFCVVAFVALATDFRFRITRINVRAVGGMSEMSLLLSRRSRLSFPTEDDAIRAASIQAQATIDEMTSFIVSDR